MTKAVFAIKDAHNKSEGRLRAQGILQSGGVSVFFIEWARPVKPNSIVADFSGIANDAKPDLIDLSRLALTLGIPVVSCDLDPEETVKRLDGLNDGFGPYSIHSVIQPWGEAVRDKHAATKIVDYMRAHHDPNCRGLLMFGADHFEAKDGRGALPLNKLIIKQRLDCYIVSNNSTDVNF